jgi:hypothetical protein
MALFCLETLPKSSKASSLSTTSDSSVTEVNDPCPCNEMILDYPNALVLALAAVDPLVLQINLMLLEHP